MQHVGAAAEEVIDDAPHQVLVAGDGRGGQDHRVALDDADLVSAGSVAFRETPLGTEVSVVMQYAPPVGKPGAALAWFFGETPAQQLRTGLERMQHELEQKAEFV